MLVKIQETREAVNLGKINIFFKKKKKVNGKCQKEYKYQLVLNLWATNL